MSGKTIVLKTPQRIAEAADNWVQAPAKDQSQKPAKVVRLTFEIDEALHLRMKLHCTAHRTSMADFLRSYLNEKFPASPAPTSSE